MKIAKVMTSGVKGAESGAIIAAQKAGITITGWRSKGSETDYPQLQETSSAKEEQSVIWNVRDSHATLIIKPVSKYLYPNLALEVADSYKRPVCVSDDPSRIINWLNKLGEELVLNVIGPNEKELEGSERATKKIMDAVFAYYNSSMFF